MGFSDLVSTFLKNSSRSAVIKWGVTTWILLALCDLGAVVVLRQTPTLIVPPGSSVDLAAPPPPPSWPPPSPPTPPPSNSTAGATAAAATADDDSFPWHLDLEFTDDDYLVKWTWDALVHGLKDFRHDTVDVLLLFLIRVVLMAFLARLGVTLGKPKLDDIKKKQPAAQVTPLLINSGEGELHQLSHEADKTHLESYDRKKQADIKKNLISGLLFLLSTACQIYIGIKVILFNGHWRDGNAPSHTILTVQGVLFFSSVLFINAEAFVATRLMMTCCEEEGFLVPEFHPHRLFFAKMPGHMCDLCRNQAPMMYRCDICDFDCCPACFNKKDKATGEGVMRGDSGVRDVLEVGRWDYLKRGISLIWPHLPLFLFALLCLILQSVASLVLPNFQGKIFDHVISAYHTCSAEPGTEDCESHRNWFFHFIFAYVLVSIALGLLQAFRSLAFQIVARRIAIWVRQRLFRILLRQDIAFFDGMRTGDLQSRLSEDVAYMVQPIYTTLSTVLSNLMLLTGGVTMCFLTSWRLSMLAFTTILPMMHITGVYAEFSRFLNKQIYQHYSDVMSRMGEAVNMIRTVRAMSTEELEGQRNDAVLHKALMTGIKDALAGGVAVALNDYLDLLAGVLILLYGGTIAMDPNGSISVGQLITYQLYWNMINTSIQALNDMVNAFTRAAGAAERVLSLYDLKPDIDPDLGADVDIAVRRWDIAFEDVEFHYQMRPENKILNGMSFKVNEGNVCALVGRSGGGKSTMVHLLLRFYDPRAGRISLGGVDLRELKIGSMHKHIGVVSQETQLFNSTIGENISYGFEDRVTNADIVEAAKAAQAYKFISEFEDGLSTRVGERGQRLSGGQKQRIAIARCLLRKPKLLLLDEATSALDAESEALVQKALDVLIYGAQADGNPIAPAERGAGSKTVVLVAHRLSTVINSHTIVVVDKGRAAEQGTHEELLARDGVYSMLVAHQVQKQKEQISEATEEAEKISAAASSGR